MHHKYFALNMSSLSCQSFSWRSICRLKPFVEDHLCWSVGSSTQVSIWHDPWFLLRPLLHCPFFFAQYQVLDEPVSYLIDDGDWNWVCANKELPPRFVSLLCEYPPTAPSCTDHLLWTFSRVKNSPSKLSIRAFSRRRCNPDP